jgi:hypothetical protein
VSSVSLIGPFAFTCLYAFGSHQAVWPTVCLEFSRLSLHPNILLQKHHESSRADQKVTFQTFHGFSKSAAFAVESLVSLVTFCSSCPCRPMEATCRSVCKISNLTFCSFHLCRPMEATCRSVCKISNLTFCSFHLCRPMEATCRSVCKISSLPRWPRRPVHRKLRMEGWAAPRQR